MLPTPDAPGDGTADEESFLELIIANERVLAWLARIQHPSTSVAMWVDNWALTDSPFLNAEGGVAPAEGSCGALHLC
eukprot:gene21573-28568_t